MADKVYCKGCKHFIADGFNICTNPKNAKESPISPGLYNPSIYDVNGDNTCKFFEVEVIKIYCRDCNYYVFNASKEEGKCYSPKNMTDSFLGPKTQAKFSPSYINNNNDCGYFSDIHNKDQQEKEDIVVWFIELSTLLEK